MPGQPGTSNELSDRDGLAAAADPQTASLFLAILPLEVRKMVYEELWRSSGLRKHVFCVKHDKIFSTCACVSDPDAEDVRFDKYMDMDLLSDQKEAWNTRLKTDWNIHWKCGEVGDWEDGLPVYRETRRERSDNPLGYVPIIRTCKRLYLECTESLYESITFCFTDTMIARDFLSRQRVDQIQSVELAIRVKPIITELYYPGPHGGLQPQVSGFPVTASNNPWEGLCRVLCNLTNLRNLRIYLESEDLRPWHSRVAEVRFLKSLFGVKAKNFLLELPELPDEETSDQPRPRNFARRWDHRDPELAGMYLTPDKLEEAPFTVLRGPRPNNWQAHLTNLGQRGRRGSSSSMSRFLAAHPAPQATVASASVAPF